MLCFVCFQDRKKKKNVFHLGKWVAVIDKAIGSPSLSCCFLVCCCQLATADVLTSGWFDSFNRNARAHTRNDKFQFCFSSVCCSDLPISFWGHLVGANGHNVEVDSFQLEAQFGQSWTRCSLISCKKNEMLIARYINILIFFLNT